MKATLRTFIAVEIDRSVRDRAESLIQQFRNAAPDVKWVARENLHLTLKFLGDVPATDTPEIIEALASAVPQKNPFELEIYGAGAFPDVRRPRTIWLGTRTGIDPMVVLHRQIEAALKKLRFPPEGRKFTPHLTIGRVRDGGANLGSLGQLLQKHADDAIGRTRVEEVVLFASHLDPAGPTYEALGRVSLSNTSCNPE